jgi:hypothetical protein
MGSDWQLRVFKIITLYNKTALFYYFENAVLMGEKTMF